MLLQFVTLCSCFVSPFANVLAQQPPSPPILNAEIDAFINDLLTDWNSLGGVSVAVVRKTGNDTWNVETKGYGVAKADGTNVTAQTLFAIGSNSKVSPRPLALCTRLKYICLSYSIYWPLACSLLTRPSIRVSHGTLKSRRLSQNGSLWTQWLLAEQR